MKLLIVANGHIRNAGWYKSSVSGFQTVIAADGGADNCMKLGITPDYIIGDLDSITPESKEKFGDKSKIIHDDNQDKTDLQLAIGLANSLKPERITIIGAIGERIDHTIANILCLSEAKAEAEIVDENNDIRLVKKGIELSGKVGEIVSVIALSDVEGLTYSGLKWGVKGLNVPSGWIGVCNEMTSEKASISMSSGKIIVVKSRDKIDK